MNGDPPTPSEDDPAELADRLLEDCLERPESEWSEAVAEACRRHPGAAALLEARFELLRQAGLIAERDGPEGDFPEQLGEFRLLERLGGGGMGVVYLAEQSSLGRRVALKLIRPEYLFFEGSRQRFRREIEAVALLQHPGIIPIYTVGEERGVPYFAMEHIQGCTLAEVLAQVEGRESHALDARAFARAIAAACGAGPPDDDAIRRNFGTSWHGACMRVLRQVAEALGHAHGRGVLHRDVKPSNIMLTPTGRVLLLDFGLAQAEGTQKLTRTGTTLGSLAYMSPEQLRGEHSGLEPTTDIYSLGATFYELLTLNLPFREANDELLRRAILAGHPTEIRKLNRAVLREVATICLTAMQRDAARRYPTAAELVADITNALERRPIKARRPGPWLRAMRWCQRHPVATATALVALLAGNALTVTTHFQNQRIAAEKRTAFAHLDRFRNLILDLVHDLHDQLARQPISLEMRALLLDRAREALDEFREQVGQTPDFVHLNLASAYLKIGDLQAGPGASHRGELDAARESYRAARELTEAHLERHPENRTARLAAATCRTRLSQLARPAEALAHAEAADELLAPLLATETPDAAAVRLQAICRLRQGEACAELGRDGDADRLLDEAHALCARFVEQHPLDVDARRDLAAVAMRIGERFQIRGETERAMESYRRARDLTSELLESDKRNIEWQRNTAVLAQHMAVLRWAQGELDPALTNLEEALERYERLCARDPESPMAHADLVRCRVFLAQLALEREEHPEARAAFAAAWSDLRGTELAAELPRTLLLEVVTALCNECAPESGATPIAERVELFGLVLQILTESLQKGDRELWRELARRASDLGRALYAECAANAPLGQRLVAALSTWVPRWRAHEPAAAIPLLELAAGYWLARHQRQPGHADLRYRAWFLVSELALALSAVGPPDKAMEIHSRAVALAREGCGRHPADERFARALGAAVERAVDLALREGLSADAERHARVLLSELEGRAERQGASARDLDRYARRLLSIEPEGLRDIERGLAYARRASELDGGSDPATLETLARTLGEWRWSRGGAAPAPGDRAPRCGGGARATPRARAAPRRVRGRPALSPMPGTPSAGTMEALESALYPERPIMILRLAAIALATSLCAHGLSAQASFVYLQTSPIELDSGPIDHPGGTPRVVFRDTVDVPGAASLRLFFGPTELPVGSRLRLRSLRDGAVQHFDAASLAEYSHGSAYFNGDSVELELVAAPRSRGNRVSLERAEWSPPGIVVPETICGGTDDRVLSSDPRIGRAVIGASGCSWWLVNEFTLITAGHCAAGASAPAIVGFNIPLSLPNGTKVHPPPDDQYPLDVPSLWHLNSGVGRDWAVIASGRNSNHGLYAGQRQGSWFTVGTVPGQISGVDIRITGNGAVSAPISLTWNRIQKTHVGPRVATSTANALRYQTDTSSGNSGSPVIHEATGHAIGVHTHGGCRSSGGLPTGGNSGTRVDRTDFAAAIAFVRNSRSAGSYSTYGAGCAGSTGTPGLEFSGIPDIGQTLNLHLHQLAANRAGTLILGISDSAWGGLSLPLDLAGIGMSGCELLASADILVALPTGAGSPSVPIPIPGDSNLVGFDLFLQYMALDPGAPNLIGAVITNAGHVRFGD